MSELKSLPVAPKEPLRSRVWYPLQLDSSGISCGIYTLSGVSAFNEIQGVALLHRGAVDMDSDPVNLVKGCTYLFSDNTSGAATDFVKFINEHKLGTVIPMWRGVRKNPNSGANIRAWSWRYNGKKLPKDLISEYFNEDNSIKSPWIIPYEFEV